MMWNLEIKIFKCIYNKIRLWGLERCRAQWKFLLEVLYLPWTTLLKVKRAQVQGLVSSFWALVALSVKAGPTHLWHSMSLRARKLSFCMIQILYVRVSRTVLQSIFMPSQSSLWGKRNVSFFVEACAFLILYLQLSANICWINEWTNECELVTEDTETNEARSLPLRSSQSIEHRQPINTGHASWVAHSSIQKHRFIYV